jgi:23S rRNA-/tRNA-specific pseudouridylate synthase
MEPLTGRTHQLRVQCALRGIPIIGDKSYGDFSYNRKLSRASKTDRLCLHAAEIEFELKTNNSNRKISSDSPLPRAMGKLMM